MVRRCSIVEAGDDLPMLVREAESGVRIELIRDGRSVAAIVPLFDDDQDLGVVGNSLDHLFGCWSVQEEQEFLQAIEVFERVDEPLV